MAIAPASVWNTLRLHCFEPSPIESDRRGGDFLRAEATTMLAYGFFTGDAALLRSFYVLFFIELDTRRVYVTGSRLTRLAPRWLNRPGICPMSYTAGPSGRVPDPGSRYQVHDELRRGRHFRGHPDQPHSDPGAPGERLR